MKCERRTVLTLTKEEQKTIKSLVDIFYEDDNLSSGDIIDIMELIAHEKYSLVENYDYTIVVIDK